MSYVKQTWVDRAVEFFRRFTYTDDGTHLTLTEAPGTITNAGTPLDSTRLNHIEEGIYDAHENVGDRQYAEENYVVSGETITESVNKLDTNLNLVELWINNKREVLFDGSWSNGQVKTLTESIYDYSFILIYWTTAPVVAISCPVIPSSSLLRGGNLYIAETGNIAINSVMFNVSGSGKELTLVRAAHAVNLASPADRIVGTIYGVR